ncbi:MAG TPA: phosphatase PAP2 family protein [Thermoanaerobaculaceae bacterium]|nr:phosphatase PAP2 family protein [Thermoanaerobaculaceae bacterium]
MVRARSTGARVPRFRSFVPLLLAIAATCAVPRLVPAGEPALTLGLSGRAEAVRPFEAAWPEPPPAVFGLGADPALLAPAAPPGEAPDPAVEADAVPTRPAAAAVPRITEYPHRVWQDLGALVRRPLAFDSHDWTHLAVGVGVVGLVSAFDARIRNTVQGHASVSARNFANRIRPLGTWGGVAAMGVLLGVGELSGDASLADTGADGVEASLFAGALVAPAVKELAGRQRPNAGDGAFEPISKGQSFPSGEATEAFTIAAVVSNHTSSPVVRGLAWGLAGLVGWERMVLNAHWASDVVAGALIGCTVGNWVSRRNSPDGARSIALQPMLGPGVVGVSGSASW